jgi:hypothetical protein
MTRFILASRQDGDANSEKALVAVDIGQFHLPSAQ